MEKKEDETTGAEGGKKPTSEGPMRNRGSGKTKMKLGRTKESRNKTPRRWMKEEKREGCQEKKKKPFFQAGVKKFEDL